MAVITNLMTFKLVCVSHTKVKAKVQSPCMSTRACTKLPLRCAICHQFFYLNDWQLIGVRT